MLADGGGLYVAGHHHCFVKCRVQMQEHIPETINSMNKLCYTSSQVQRMDVLLGGGFIIYTKFHTHISHK
jgi:hypothetical protein